MKPPKKSRMRNIADQLWSRAVRDDWANRCAMCGAGGCDAHHLVPRQHEATRYELRNGIALCPSHHRFDRDLAPHQNPVGFVDWLESNHPSIADWYRANKSPKFNGTKNAPYYCETIKRLQEYVEPEDFTRICGVRFEQYLEEME